MEIGNLFGKHLEDRLRILDTVLGHFNLDGLVLGAGAPTYYYQDDQAVFYRTSHHFSHYCPISGAEHGLILSPNKKPMLFQYDPEDFWYDHAPLEKTFWSPHFEIKSFSTTEALWKSLAEYKTYGYLGPDTTKAREIER